MSVWRTNQGGGIGREFHIEDGIAHGCDPAVDSLSDGTIGKTDLRFGSHLFASAAISLAEEADNAEINMLMIACYI